MIGSSLWETASKHELSTINMLHPLKKLSYYTLPPHNGRQGYFAERRMTRKFCD